MGEQIKSIKIFLDEDNFTDKFRELPIEERKKCIRFGLLVCNCASDFQKKGLISKTISHRIHWILDIFNDNNNFIQPSKFKELFDIKPINIKFFRNALLVFWKVAESKEGKEIFNYNLKVHKELFKLNSEGNLNSSQP